MPIALHNLIVLGDSLSDIGIKREAPTGMLARAAKAMRTNEIGRYSDGRNWTDFLVEWAGAEPLVRGDAARTESATRPHRSLSKSSLLLSTDTADAGPLRYANYAEGGAIAAADWAPKAGALGYLKTQVREYIAAREALGALYGGDTLHIIWIGLNDIVTAAREPGIRMSAEVDENGVFEVPERMTDVRGTGITPLVQEIHRLVNKIADAFPNSRDHEHFLLIDLPDPSVSIRFQDKAADGRTKQLERCAANTARFNDLLRYVTSYWPAPGKKGGLGANPANVALVQMNAWMQYVSDNPKDFQLTHGAQFRGVPVCYLGAADPVEPAIRRCLTTSDLAHPTEAVYQLIARKIAEELLTRYRLGRLDARSWQGLKPFATVGN